MGVFYLTMALVIVGSYFIGNVNFAILISKLKNRDVRNVGSGNPGTINMLRSFGIKLGALTLVLDALKGAIPALIGWWLLGGKASGGAMLDFSDDKLGLFVAGFSVVIGHIFPVLYKFKGGKGVATSIGIGFVASPLFALVAFIVAFVYMVLYKVGAPASFIAIGVPLVYEGVVSIMNGFIVAGIIAFVIYALVIFAHRSNLVRIFRGKENMIVLFGKNKSAKHVQEINSDAQENAEQEKK